MHKNLPDREDWPAGIRALGELREKIPNHLYSALFIIRAQVCSNQATTRNCVTALMIHSLKDSILEEIGDRPNTDDMKQVLASVCTAMENQLQNPIQERICADDSTAES
jgi:hypothetical protein